MCLESVMGTLVKCSAQLSSAQAKEIWQGAEYMQSGINVHAD